VAEIRVWYLTAFALDPAAAARNFGAELDAFIAILGNSGSSMAASDVTRTFAIKY